MSHATSPQIGDDDVVYDRRDAVAVITVNRPDARNAVTAKMFDGVRDLVVRAGDEGVKALVLTGAGRYFCAGVDLKAVLGAAGREQAALASVLEAGNRAVLAIRDSPLPSVSAVEGGAVGGGLGLALSTDLCVVARGARLSTQYARVGMTPDVGLSYQLTQRLGVRLAAAQLLRSPVLDGATALSLGLVDVVVPDGQAVATALDVAAELAERPAVVVAGARALTEAAGAGNTLSAQLELEREWVHRGWEGGAAQAYAAAFMRRGADPGSWSATSRLS